MADFLTPAGKHIYASATNPLPVAPYCEFSLLVARGLVNGHSSMEKFGRNSDIDTGSTPEDVWGGGGVYTGFPDETETVDVSSSSGNDTSAGTGARTVRLYGQLAGVEQTEDVILNGTSNVTTTATWTRLNRIRVLTAGSGGENAGAITVHHTTTTANVFAIVPAGANRSQIVAWTVPAGKTLYIDDFHLQLVRASGAAGSATACILMREPGGVWEQMFTTSMSTGSPTAAQTSYFFTAPVLTDLVARILDVSDNNSEVSAHVIGVYVDD